ncbi:quinone oxidoreductase family protein [Actinomadura montaniterrae]|uniref:Quinone oxidoreductase n=1 Tax=Actinomadura montaniterrae TaxID=1803903 RepID=A0A6L3W6D9_9ACTN|nr:quinone oxidoreductase [Actinomadura montaniterrae]KAB2390458.1 quinone oxidoreductase [Actinomadura montaniterrae]
MQAIVVEQLGGPEELRIAERPDPRPGPGEISVRVSAAGVNFMDTGARRLGPAVGQVPFVPGVEGAGRVSALGEGVTEFAVGDRVAWVYAYGSYAEQVVMPAASAVPVPDDVTEEVAASIMMQGITAHHFTTEAAPVEPGHTTLVHAAAGGLGQKLTQLIKARGGTVIGLTSSETKAEVARQAGADHVLVCTGAAFVDPVLDLTGGQGVHTVFDGAGETTFRASMQVLRRHGTLLYYGAVIGDPPVVNMRELPNSIKICYPVFRDHIPTRDTLLAHTAELFQLVRQGRLRVEIGRRYPLKDAAQAHRDIESRATTGKLLLLP